MIKTKDTFVTAFALFSLFFGAGNLILPPFLGFKSAELWWLVALGFCLSAVFVPVLGIIAHAKLQGTIFDFGKKVSPIFSLGYSIMVYLISISLPSPRTASVTHEIAIAPFFETPPLLTSIIYFGLVLVFVLNRSKMLNIIGKILTPAILIILVLIIGITLFSFDFSYGNISFGNPFSEGILEGYQTFDAIGAIVVGGVIIISINLKKKEASYKEKKSLITKAAWLAGFALFLVYAGLIVTGALMHGSFNADVSRTDLLSGISLEILGNTGNILLSLLVALACFTTAVGIVTGTSDFVKHRFKDSDLAYRVAAVLGCILGVLVGQFNVDYIIAVAVPALMFIYPITIVLIILNALPNKLGSAKVFKWVIAATIIFSIPDFIGSIGLEQISTVIKQWIPFSKNGLGWILPTFIVFIIINLLPKQDAAV